MAYKQSYTEKFLHVHKKKCVDFLFLPRARGLYIFIIMWMTNTCCIFYHFEMDRFFWVLSFNRVVKCLLSSFQISFLFHSHSSSSSSFLICPRSATEVNYVKYMDNPVYAVVNYFLLFYFL